MSNARIFFAGMGTTVLLLGAGFSGGLMLASTAIDSLPQNKTAAADRLQPVRVVLPATAEAAPAPAQPATSVATSGQPAQAQNPPAKEMQAAAEKDQRSERAEQRRAEYAERERHERFAERKARRDAARLKQRDQQQQEARPQERPGILAFGFDEAQRRPGGFFGN